MRIQRRICPEYFNQAPTLEFPSVKRAVKDKGLQKERGLVVESTQVNSCIYGYLGLG